MTKYRPANLQTCLICQRPTAHPDKLCPLCLPLVEHLRSATSLTPYEQQALTFAIEHVGGHVEANGTDLSEWTEEQVRGFARDLVDAYGVGLREQIASKECPF